MTVAPYATTSTVLYGVMQEASCTTAELQWDPLTTLNKKYGFATGLVPSVFPTKILCFGVGRGGARNATDTTGQYVIPPSSAYGDLYQPIPVRRVPLSDPLTATERAGVCGRRVVTDSAGVQWEEWMYKLVTTTSQYVSMTILNADGIEEPYTFDYANMSPTQPTLDANGVVTSDVGTITASVGLNTSLTTAQMQEVISGIDNGSMVNCNISELMLVQGELRSVTAKDINNVEFTYKEIVGAQAAFFATFQSRPFTLGTGDWNQTWRLSPDKSITA